jgi:alkylation response protein AidB-like acyl-CoA dehydrogenase
VVAPRTFPLHEAARDAREEARTVVADRIEPRARELARTDTYPADILADLGERGLAGLTLSPEHGGRGTNVLALTVVVEELSRAMMPVASALALNLGVARVIEAFGTDDQRAEYLSAIAAFETVGALGLSEAAAGSDKSGIETTGTRDGDEWVLSGQKRWVTNVHHADLILTDARTGPPEAWPHNVTAFLVPADAVDHVTTWDTLGARSVKTAEVSLDLVRVADHRRIGPVGEGYVQRGELSNGLNVPARGVGIARAALADARSHARSRIQGGHPIADFQGLRWRLAEMARRVDTAALLTRRAAWLADRDEPSTRAARMAKVAGPSAAVDNANDAMDLLAGIGYTTERDVERSLRDARLLPIAGGPTDVHRDALADAVLAE